MTLDGWQVWETVLEAASQLPLAADGGPIGLDLSAMLALGRARGLDEAMLAERLPAAERGLIAGMAKHKAALR